MSRVVQRLIALIPVTALVVGGSLLVHVDSASAFGYNRAVNRSCGDNGVSSTGDLTSGQAMTSHYSGSCNDKLVAGLNHGGAVKWTTSTTVRGTARHAASGLGDTTGRHKGCPSCAVTLS